MTQVLCVVNKAGLPIKYCCGSCYGQVKWRSTIVQIGYLENTEVPEHPDLIPSSVDESGDVDIEYYCHRCGNDLAWPPLIVRED